MQARPEDPTLVVLVFGATVLLAAVMGVILVVFVLPAFGEFVGNCFFQPDEELGPSLHEEAQDALARGDAAAAMKLYGAALLKNARDRIATAETARLLCEHRLEPGAGRDFLEAALRRDWPPEDFAFLILRLAEIYAFHLHDVTRARELWQRTLLVYPATPHADEARDRLAALEGGD